MKARGRSSVPRDRLKYTIQKSQNVFLTKYLNLKEGGMEESGWDQINGTDSIATVRNSLNFKELRKL